MAEEEHSKGRLRLSYIPRNLRRGSNTVPLSTYMREQIALGRSGPRPSARLARATLFVEHTMAPEGAQKNSLYSFLFLFWVLYKQKSYSRVDVTVHCTLSSQSPSIILMSRQPDPKD